MWEKQDDMCMAMTTVPLTPLLLRTLYARMLLTRLVDEHIVRLHAHGYGNFVASCRGHEAAQIGTAICIEVGRDFTLPYYRDLGVVLTIGMTPYEIFRTYLQAPGERVHLQAPQEQLPAYRQPMPHWGYHKHNTVMGPAPVATHILHAAGIAFASKLRKVPVVTVAYCGDGAASEPDFLEGVRFAVHHRLPAIFICEQDCTEAGDNSSLVPSCLQGIELPAELAHYRLDGTDVAAVYTAMQQAMQQAREGNGPILLEMRVIRSTLATEQQVHDPLVHCKYLLQERGAWDQQWADALSIRLSEEVEQAMHNALQDLVPAEVTQNLCTPAISFSQGAS
jgi:2-oxoisovalerate dehydrogenase E1 component alpha subunit